MTAERFGKIRKWILGVAWVYFFYTAYMLLSPRPYILPPMYYVFNIIHFGAFVVLGGLVGLARVKWSSRFWWLLLVFWGCGSEYIQRYTGRCFQYGDMIQNVCGISFGLYAAFLLRFYFVKRVDSNVEKECLASDVPSEGLVENE